MNIFPASPGAAVVSHRELLAQAPLGDAATAFHTAAKKRTTNLPIIMRHASWLRLRTHRPGFTLIELLVVIAIPALRVDLL
jgi:prepilin-type N-terminal cleavage/methylation domain-containing protein